MDGLTEVPAQVSPVPAECLLSGSMQHAALPSLRLDHQTADQITFLPRGVPTTHHPPPSSLCSSCSPVDLHPALRAQPLPA